MSIFDVFTDIINRRIDYSSIYVDTDNDFPECVPSCMIDEMKGNLATKLMFKHAQIERDRERSE